MSNARTVLVLGGYGFFGRRIVEILSRDRADRILVAGRRREQALATCGALGLPESSAVALDGHAPMLAGRLRELGVGIVVHTAGPFQRQDYTVARAAIEAACHYIDLADARDFVADITTLDAEARRAGVTVISGASSVPGLSSAVVNRYAGRFGQLDAIRIGIASGARSPGLATVKGIFGYCGKPFLRWEGGAPATTHGWLDLSSHRFPDPVGTRLLGSCDVPDLALFPKRHPGVQTVTFHAGFAAALGHLVVWALAKLVQAGWLGSVAPFAGPLHRIGGWIEPLVSDKGGMFVALEGTGLDGRPLTLTWHLVAEHNDGPYVPCGAAVALVRKLARENALPAGAMPCVGLLGVEEVLAPFDGLAIREVPPATEPASRAPRCAP